MFVCPFSSFLFVHTTTPAELHYDAIRRGGDVDLKATVDAANGQDSSVHDACVLQFEFRCANDTYVPHVSFQYLWGSDEYLEYVGSGFYLNGENVARVPDSDADQDFVSINSVNHESNARYFNRNDHVEIQHALPGAKSRLVIGRVWARKCARARDATPSLRGPVSPVRTSVRARGPPRLPPAGG